MKHRAEDQYDLADGILASRDSMPGHDEHSRLDSELFAQKNRLWSGGRRVHTHEISSVKLVSPRGAAQDAAERKVLSGSVECGGCRSRRQKEVGKGKGWGRAEVRKEGGAYSMGS